MKLIADLHIHSHFSIATSRHLVPEYLDLWARIKGINIVGTGDFTHPSWIDELEEKLEPAEEGLYKLRREFRIGDEWGLHEGFGDPVRFLLSAEISSIYKWGGKVRKVHNVVLAPDFDTVRKIQAALSRRKFNITSDGRPILGLDSRDLLEMILEISDRTVFIPAHIWTPWFSALGAKSGFNTIEECYRDLSSHIHAVETGLSSDPAMNWMCGFLDKYTLVSNSDAHSPEKLGREGNILDTELSYGSVTGAIESGSRDEFLGTIEFFPQEGKYHYDGHRKCGICWDPLENLRHQGICPGCGKPVTMGVMSRIAQLSDRDDITERRERAPFHSIIPLKEMLSEILEVGPNSRKVDSAYRKVITAAGPEFGLLLDTGIEEIESAGGPLLSEAVRRMRSGEVHIQEGYDGEFGIIRLFEEGEARRISGASSLFLNGDEEGGSRPEPKMLRFSLKDYRSLAASLGAGAPLVGESRVGYAASGDLFASAPVGEVFGSGQPSGTLDPDEEGPGRHFILNPEQQAAVTHGPGPSMVIAGPGTGKTQVLTRRILHLVREEGTPPGVILAVTFTNKAAEEMSRRIARAFGQDSEMPVVSTFHALGHMILRRNPEDAGRGGTIHLIGPDDQTTVIQDILGCTRNQAGRLRGAISRFKQDAGDYREISDPEVRSAAGAYEEWLRANSLFDLDDLIAEAVHLLEGNPGIRDYWQARFKRVLVDEFQDINRAQYRLLRLLCPAADSSICVIGDPDQAIYGFRGSDAVYLKSFLEDYPSSAVYSLKRSYRCTDTILQASAGVLNARTSGQDPLQGLGEGVRLKISDQPTDRSEAEFIARTIEEMVGGLRSFSLYSRISGGEEAGSIRSLSDFAVLCRTARQMELFEEAFNNHAVPYQRVGEGSFLKAPIVREILDLFRYAENPDHPYLGMRLEKAVRGTGREYFSLAVTGGSVKELLENIAGKLPSADIGDPAVLQLLDFAGEYGESFEAFRRFVELGSDVDLYRGGSESVALMTIHASKGLEFECVFIPGCEEGILPYTMHRGGDADIEEERRLFYVAMTRARQYLFLTHAESRVLFGRRASRRRSPFLDGIEARLVEELKAEERKKEQKGKKAGERKLKLF